MDLNALGNMSVMAGIKLVLASTGSLQEFIDRPGVTHEFCNNQALVILRHEGQTDCADFFQKYAQELNAGVYWADTGWKNKSHYFIPATGAGLWRFRSAVDEFEIYFHKATQAARSGDWRSAVFYLGAAIHLVQDACVPHHARGKLFDGHKEYEEWAQTHFAYFKTEDKVMDVHYNKFATWLVKNASISADMLKMVDHKATEESYFQATAILLPQAQRSTAGIIAQFYHSILRVYCSPALLRQASAVA